jgi:NTE family protein
MKIGLALGGGSSKGLAHIGVLQVLEEENIPINIICGTSIGAIVGAVYSLNPDAHWLEEKAKKVLASDEFENVGFDIFNNKDYNLFKRITTFVKEKYSYGKALFRPSIVDRKIIEDLLEEILDKKRFEDTKIPLGVVAIDIARGKDVVLKNKGPLLPAVAASIAIPGLFPYIKSDRYILVDGGATQDVPVEPLREMGADIVIASSLATTLETKSFFRTGLDVNFRVDEIVRYRLIVEELKKADVIITPDIKHIHWADYGKLEFCIQKGREAAIRALPEIRQKLRGTVFHKLRRLFKIRNPNDK